MAAIRQLKLPPELQDHIKEYVYYSKEESIQRLRKDLMTEQLNRCCRWWSKLSHVDPYYDLFFYRIEKYNYYLYSNVVFIEYYHTSMSSVFCKTCHNYVSSMTDIPACIECDCLPDILDVD